MKGQTNKMQKSSSASTPYTSISYILFLFLLPFVLTFEIVYAAAGAGASASSSANSEPVDAIGRVIYDQRQTGKYNIHVSIKDVAIIQMDENEINDETYNDGDYYYDEADLTVKPITLRPPTTAIPMKTTTIISSKTTLTTPLTTRTTITKIPMKITTTPNLKPNNVTNISSSISNGNDSLPTTTNKNSITTTITTKTTAQNLLVDVNENSSTNLTVIMTNEGDLQQQQNQLQKLKTNSTPILLSSSSLSSSKKEVTVKPLDLNERTLKIANTNTPIKSTTTQQLPSTILSTSGNYATPSGSDSNSASGNSSDSKIYKFKAARRNFRQQSSLGAIGLAHQPMYYAERCRANQYRDINGNCRAKRSSSILKKLFKMLVTLPFVHENKRGNNNYNYNYRE